MRVTKMLTEKFIFVFIFFGLAFVEERFMRSKRTCFCFFKTVNCQTVTLVTQKKSFLETVICYLLFVTQKIHLWKLSTVNCNAWGWCH